MAQVVDEKIEYNADGVTVTWKSVRDLVYLGHFPLDERFAMARAYAAHIGKLLIAAGQEDDAPA
jgi:hypothetical protein